MASIISYTFREAVVDIQYKGKKQSKLHCRDGGLFELQVVIINPLNLCIM